MTTTLSISEAREQLPTLIGKIGKYLSRAIITVRGKPTAVVLNFEELESIEETIKILSIPNARKNITKGKKEISQNEITTLEELKKLS
jgi:antitoxin YefM